MSANARVKEGERDNQGPERAYGRQALSRASHSPLIEGNSVRLLIDAKQNYPAWLEAIRTAKHHVHFESYIIHEDDVGRQFAETFITKAQEGVRVRVAYDWMGGFGKTSRRFWRELRAGGVEVRCYNPPRLDSPFGWLSRDHRKMLEIDGRIAFIAGLCVGKAWVGDPSKKIEPWRDTGIEIRGTAVPEVAHAFATIWALMGDPIPSAGRIQDVPERAGDVAVRVVSTMPMTAGMSRVDELVAALATKRLWLTDAYYAGMTSYVQALTSAAKDGIDVRLLVPGGTDIAILRPLSRAGYRPLLEAGARVFEWNGPMLHAKTAVADGKWARVGSSNLNAWSWFGNCELDLVVEDERFGREMEEMYLQDLTNATEIVLDLRNRVRAPKGLERPAGTTSSGGSISRAAAGTLRLGSAVGAALTNRRVFEPVEARILLAASALLFGLATLFWFHPKALVYPVIVLFLWSSLCLLFKAYKVRRQDKQSEAQNNTEIGGVK